MLTSTIHLSIAYRADSTLHVGIAYRVDSHDTPYRVYSHYTAYRADLLNTAYTVSNISSRACGGLRIPESSFDPIRSISLSRSIFFLYKAPQSVFRTSSQSETAVPTVCQLVRPPFLQSPPALFTNKAGFLEVRERMWVRKYEIEPLF